LQSTCSTLQKKKRRPEAPVVPELLNARQAAALLGVSLRTLHNRRRELPPAIILGPKCIRWRRADLVAWVAGLQPGDTERREPAQLIAARARRHAAGDPAGEPGVTGAHHGPRIAAVMGARWPNQESNRQLRTEAA
jgi:predicted DNA-binding transcriptional regulator AlpA